MSMRKRLVSIIAVVAMLAAMLSVNAYAEETDAVAQIGDTTYATLDEALAAASDGDTIIVLQSTTVSKINLRNSNYGGIDIDLTIKGAEGVNPTITFTDAGIQTSSHTLTLEDCTIVMNDLQAPNVSWGTIFFDTGGVMNLNNVTMTLDGTNAPSGGTNAIYTHGIYFYGSNTMNVTNSTVTIQNYPQDALEWSGDYPDGNRATYDLNIVNSTFICDNNRSGLAGTFDMKIDNSIVKVTDSTGNGSNGTYYTITNNSYVEFTGNRNWGISAYRIDMTDNSTLIACDNGYSGVWTRILNVDGTCTLDVERNGNHALSPTTTAGASTSTSAVTNAGIFLYGNGSNPSVIENGAVVTIKDNAGSGIYTAQSVAKLTINTAAEITNNGTGAVDTYNGYGATYGGGIMTAGTVVLCDDVIIYNNHASIAGDDIYSTKSITFGDVNSNAIWVLDDCDHIIDGWYEDGYETETDEDGNEITQRWSANCEDEGYIYTEVRDSGTYTTTIAYKAAHGVDSDTAKVTEPGLVKTIITADGEVKQDDVAAGDTVDYKLTSTVPSTLTDYIDYTYDAESSTAVGTVNYTTDEDGNKIYDTYTLTFHDSVADALTVDTDSIKVYIGDEELSSDYYSINTEAEDCTFEVSMDLLALYTADVINEANFGRTAITVTYSATLSSAATAGAYTNTAWVSYLDKTSEKDQVEVDTYGISIFKYDQSTAVTDEEGNTTYTGLAGAKFELRMQVSEDTEGALTDSDGNYYIVVATLTSGEDGYVTYEGLDAGTYYLKETEAPEGYVKADTVLTIVLPDNVDAETNLASVDFANAPIPSTGGAGTTMFTVVGGCILLAAGVIFVISRKKRNAE